MGSIFLLANLSRQQAKKITTHTKMAYILFVLVAIVYGEDVAS